MENSNTASAATQSRSFQDLDCWKKCREVRRLIFDLTKKFPKDELFALTQNTRRAAYSTTQNIAEGYGRFHYQENVQFCRQSRGSLYELWDQMIAANDNGYISSAELENVVNLINETLRILNGYINFLLNEQEKKSQTKKSKSLLSFLLFAITVFYLPLSVLS